MMQKENFFQGVISEMKKTTWPTGKEVVRDTTIVVLTVLFFILFFYAVDLGITELIKLIN
ncbi:preprotein translocase subunit SecE [Macrococcus brunensis]|uniref:Protein translocase subunit SecE n=2 Tax=Macrococcus brunensis TaxID=198483 RepID=A0A4R6BDX3_9STAP|nr:preprotein translocase subunit SecE [Macrococcus brunensis]TDL98001.1 preprotein translocase subunit SecE [Macrococcus brunensis]ULG73126.1 preprotein translocase subunit SecE [Macrococcus brunensis]ULG75307.1 preprotein translocase subunit SecE [Macrococcus brunensis]